MSQTLENTGPRRFHVKVGLAECTICCRDEEDAVRLARRELVRQMPQMRQIVRRIADKEFRVDSIG